MGKKSKKIMSQLQKVMEVEHKNIYGLKLYK